jgi:hypothetical protein
VKQKDELRIRRMAQTAWRKDHPDEKIASPTADGISDSLDIWVEEEIDGKTYVAVRRWMKEEVSIYEIRVVAKTVHARAAVPTERPPAEMLQAAADRAQHDHDIVLALYGTDHRDVLAFYGTDQRVNTGAGNTRSEGDE